MTKLFTIGDPAPSKHKPDTFEVQILVMHGDADSFDTVVVGPFDTFETDALTSLVETLDRIHEFDSAGWRPQEERGHDSVVGFLSWFGFDVNNEEEYYRDFRETTVPYAEFAKHAAFVRNRPGTDWWPTDPYAGEDGRLEKYVIYYYDQNLTEHAVTVEEDE